MDYEKEISELKSELARLQQKYFDIDKALVKTNASIELLIETTKMSNEQQTKAIEQLNKSIIEIKEKPTKRWELLLNTIITAVTTAFVMTYLKK